MTECNMQELHYQKTDLYLEQVSLKDVAKQVGTPTYIYSQTAIENNLNSFKAAFSSHPHKICYAVKANSTLGILRLFVKNNVGFDIVSLGELERVLAAGGDPRKIIFSGVCKTEEEISRAIDVNIYCFNVESESELERIQMIATTKNKTVLITLRVNPNIDAKTHPYISTGLHANKFGIEIEKAFALSQTLHQFPALQLIGIGCHIGSQLTTLTPFIEAANELLNLAERLREKSIYLKNINLGGGLGISYQNELVPSFLDYANQLKPLFSNTPYELILEPGRSMVGSAGILLTKVEYIKKTPQKQFAIVDAGMNDFIRPALYDAWHEILPIKKPFTETASSYDIVGPVCESADFFGINRHLNLMPTDLLAICSAGAYGSSMSSHYNSRPKAAEVLVKGDTFHLIRKRETTSDLWLNEI